MLDVDKFWAQVAEDSENYEVPVHYPDYFNQPFCSEGEVRELLQNWGNCDLETAKGTMRVFVNRGMSYAHANLMHDNPIKDGERLRAYHNRLFGKEKIGFFLNQAERFHDGLTRRAVNFTRPLAEAMGVPNFRCSLALLMGDYEETAFGVHYDNPGGAGRAVHFMLEGEKNMKCWSREEVNKLTNRKDRNYYWGFKNRLMKSGQGHFVGPDDFYLLPIQSYHIGVSQGFTVDFCIVIMNMSSGTIVQESIHRHSKILTGKLKRVSSKHRFGSTSDDSESEINELLDGGETDISLRNLLRDNILRQRSNAGVKHPPLVKKAVKLYGKNMEIVSPFQIICEINEGDMNVYVRGRVIRLFQDDALVELVEELNAGKQLSYKSCEERLSSTIDRDECHELFNMLYVYSGIALS